MWGDQVAFSTLTVRLQALDTYAAVEPRGFGERVERMIAASWQSLVSVGVAVVLLFAAVLPWIPLILASLWIVARLWRRSVGRSAVQVPAKG